MIYVKSTPNYAGVSIHGDFFDFEALYDALHTVVGEEDEFIRYEEARLRVLGVCYDIRYALLGARDITFVENGMDADKMKFFSTITSDKNVYLCANVLWPEVLFVTMALNDFIRLYAKKITKKHVNLMDQKLMWDGAIAQVKGFQAAVIQCIKENVSDAAFRRTINLMAKDYTWFDAYATQYVDLLNIRFMDMDVEKRKKNITIMAKRLAEYGQEYRDVEGEVKRAAREYECDVGEIRLALDYPDDLDW
ncbi:hypothetical protein HUG15_17465 [Salicibibacter cibarius]|uniref:Uncharacterized protein n=1 Tax=Salicibibacter cibarius TaxID=2743000 RepID=A0A7T6Z561_9BACI|nr:hypothetical protein [Salicibibacter cibarius]QQK77190.1 hypothetical protein HUG15_17465 [Salicibibacter cibarius]